MKIATVVVAGRMGRMV